MDRYEDQPEFVRRRYTKKQWNHRRLSLGRNFQGKVPAVKGVEYVDLLSLSGDDFDQLDIDDGYQRKPMPAHIGTIAQAIRQGGKIPDPIVVVRRTWNGASKKLWVVDGQQRVWAALDTGAPLDALVYEAESYEAEKLLFQALNNAKGLAARTLINSHVGPSTDLLRAISADPAHPLYKRFSLSGYATGPTSSLKWTAPALINGMYALFSRRSAPTPEMLRVTDYHLQKPEQRRMAEALLKMMARAFPDGAPRQATVAFGVVTASRWRSGILEPTPRSYRAIAQTNWRKLMPLQKKFQPLFIDEMDRKWKPKRS